MTWRRFAVLLAGLPLDSRTAIAEAADTPTQPTTSGFVIDRWPLHARLQALTLEALHTLVWMQTNRKSPTPTIVQRAPAPATRPQLDPDQIDAALAAIGPAPAKEDHA